MSTNTIKRRAERWQFGRFVPADDQLYVAGYDLSGDTGSIGNIGGGPAALEVTGIDKSAPERIGGRRDGALSWSAWFNPASNQAHPVLSALPTTDVIVSYYRGATLGNAAACCVAKQVNYDPARGGDGSLTFAVDAQANGFGVEWGEMHTAGIRTDTGATTGVGVDAPAAAASSFGLQAYLQVFAFTGTDATVKLEESSDNFSADPAADVTGGAFAQITAGRVTERIATSTSLAVERYLRVTTTTSAGFTSLAFAVAVVRNLAAPVF